MASSRPDAAMSSTLIAVRQLLWAFFKRQFNLQACVPKRRHFCSIKVASICSSPSGVVPGAVVDHHDPELFSIDGGEGHDCNCGFQFRVLCANSKDSVVIFYFLEVLYVTCKSTAWY